MKRNEKSVPGMEGMKAGIPRWPALVVLALFAACAKKPPGPALEKVNGQPTAIADDARGRGKSLTDMGFQKSRVFSVGFMPILFPLDSDQPIDHKVIATLIEEAPKYKACRIEGHTCPLGSTEYNQALGYRRAQSVAAHLALSGVKLVLVSHGESQPAEDYPSSRRVIVECEK